MYNKQELVKYNITELKNILKKHNYPLYGNKDQIIEKLIKINKIMFLDTETSGLPERLGFDIYYDYKDSKKYDNSRIIELGFIEYNNTNMLKKMAYLIKPINFTINNSDIHGITHKEASEKGLEINDVFENFYKHLLETNMIVGHNIEFDLQIIKSECHRIDRNDIIDEINKKDIICTMKLGKKKLNFYKNPKLIELYNYLFKMNAIQKHRTIDDCELCSKCYFKLI